MYKDNWLLRPNTFKPISSPTLPIDITVAGLIDEENRWDETKPNQHFIREDTEVIVKIPLPINQKKNELMWHFDKRGEYSIKSGYQVALQIKVPDLSNSSNYSSKQWNSLWSLELPEKIKLFMWKASKNLLPLAENLWIRKCVQEPLC